MADNTQKRKFLFNVDIMIEEDTNGRALEALLHLLNAGTVEDYQIKQGIELGKKIAREQEQASDIPIAKTDSRSSKTKAVSSAASGRPQADNGTANAGGPYQSVWEKFLHYQQNNTLIRLSVVKGKGVKLSLPCRILNTDESTGNVTVYHVDEKKVYLFQINEIDDFEVG
ncbi:hypothetical protein O9H85_13890 [Paenibacillus filicis]|uniref:DUF2577 domain-containing protein n=1 Tax=Paenibacillus gyeongsangnamensis TaxID=3388067 RepID=A0ABT4Q9E9_9BACL|nr:hypothetical protein [Paenibacillus filicis]MCZ8513504.1 hypothetical protein [Paenibacillus filicis]